MKKDTLSTALLLLVFFVGLSLLAYPTISDWWNTTYRTRVVSDYTQTVTNIDNEEYKRMLDAAVEYNKEVSRKKNPYYMSAKNLEDYKKLLNPSGTGVMGYIEIPVIDLKLPIYHTVSDAVLEIAIGHMEWTSLPIGGESTHSVLSGHRGLPSAKLFTELDVLKEGDQFMMQILDETFTYEVDQILIVEPDDVKPLAIEEGKDLCTLVTCTPYGINSHRLLVRGHRVDTIEKVTLRVTADAVQIDPLAVAPVVAVPVLLILLIILLISTSRPAKKHRRHL